MSEVQKYSLIEELKKADNTLQGSPSVLGMTALTYPNYINSMRSTMFTSHLKQFLNLLEPDIPYVFTNTENMVGDNSNGYYEAKGPLRIERKIVKYEGLVENPNTYILLVFDTKSKRYDIIHRNPVEDLTENFGYRHNNDFMDSLEEGDKVKKGTVLYKSSSYDDMMNYRYGKNIVVAYTLDPYTSEDAAVASESLCQKMSSIESDTIMISLNSNDYPLNLYGEDKHDYKPFPEIGEYVSDILVATRRQFNSQLLFDFKDKELREILPDDSVYYIDKNVQILDYTIYGNNDTMIDNPFYAQINKYIKYQDKYYKEVAKACEEIMNSGYEYSRDIEYAYKRSMEMIDTRKKWKYKDSQFSNMEIEVRIARRAPLAKACKLSGRYGNKSVISQIRKDEDMPYTKDGRRVDLLLNLL